MELIRRAFPELSQEKSDLLEAFIHAVREWNTRINLVSRQDINNLEERHVLHSLAIARYMAFPPGTKVLDLGTGGGFPGIPLAILFPRADFTLIDARAKKITAVRDIIHTLGLENVTARHVRAEDFSGGFDVIVTRAVATLDTLYRWSNPLLAGRRQRDIPRGLLVLKGGAIQQELQLLPKHIKHRIIPVKRYFPQPFFEEKYLIHISP